MHKVYKMAQFRERIGEEEEEGEKYQTFVMKHSLC